MIGARSKGWISVAINSRNGRRARAAAVTSVAVAKAAKVSQSTVSLVLSGKAAGRVSEATRILVEETAHRLGYQPNVSAQMLRTGVAKVLALAVPNVKQPFFGQIFVAAELTARRYEYAVILIDTITDAAWAQRLVSMLRSRLVAGGIVYAGDNAADAILRPVRNQTLFIEAEDPRKSGIDLDFTGGMRAVARHLADLGHERIGYFAAEYPKATYKRRFASFLAEAQRLGLRHQPEWQASATFELEPATLAARRLLKAAPFTALFCDDDLLAAGAYRAAARLGVAIPRQLSVVGFNDLELARMLSPELTSVAIPAEAIGKAAVERLLRQLERQTRAVGPPFVAALELHIRGSTAAPPGTVKN
jgi:LacI family transcriptional regulator/LacI family repressor for deo operon, udp, cdd, tsx, nupC, and nupG